MGKHDKDSGGSGKAWCAILLIAALLVIIVIVVLALTVFRVRNPEVTVDSFQISSFSLTFLPDGPHLTFVLNSVIAVKNRNHASFKYQPSVAYIYYHNVNIGQSPVAAGKVKAESTTTISNTATLDASSFLGNQYLAGDVQAGVIPLTVATTLHGQIDVATIVKHHATSVASCNLTVFVQTQSVGGYSCSYKLNL